MTLGLFNGTGTRHGDATLAGVKGVWVSRKMWWQYFTSDVTSGQQRGRITGYGAYLPKWVFVAGQGARANWNERRTDAPAKAFEQEVQFRSNHLNAERSDFFERLAACPDLMVLLCDGNGRFWMVGEDVGLRTSWTGKTENVQGYEITITGQQRFPTREVSGDAAQAMIQSDPTSVSPEAAAILDPEDLEYLGLDDSGCIVLGQNPVTICCGSGGGGGLTEAEVQALIDASLAGFSVPGISYPSGSEIQVGDNTYTNAYVGTVGGDVALEISTSSATATLYAASGLEIQNGPSSPLGFFGAIPVARQTISAAQFAALTGTPAEPIRDALIAYGQLEVV